MKKTCLLLILLSTILFSNEIKIGKNYIKSDSTDVLLSNKPDSKKTSVLRKGNIVDVYEIKNNYARISGYYNGNLEGLNGSVARWISIKDLSPIKPEKEKIISSSPYLKLIEDSDDFVKHHIVMIPATEKLINSGKCTTEDFRKYGSWSQSTTKSENYYFAYCGGFSSSNKIYLNVLNGEISK